MSTEILAPGSLNAFGPATSGLGQVQPSEDQLITLTYGQLQEFIQGAIKQATEPILQELEDLRARQDAPGATITSSPAQQATPDEIRALKSVLEAHHERLQDLSVRVVGLELAQDELEKLVTKTSPPKGEKTQARIEKLKAILKIRRGTASFKELRRELELKPNQFSALVATLDKRSFQVIINPRAKDEKALRLRAFT